MTYSVVLMVLMVLMVIKTNYSKSIEKILTH